MARRLVIRRGVDLPQELAGEQGFRWPLHDYHIQRKSRLDNPDRAEIPLPRGFTYSGVDPKLVMFSGRLDPEAVPYFHVELPFGEQYLRLTSLDYNPQPALVEEFAKWIEELLATLPSFWQAASQIRKNQDEKPKQWAELLGFQAVLPEDSRKDFHHFGENWLYWTAYEVKQFRESGEPLPNLSGHLIEGLQRELMDAWSKTPSGRAEKVQARQEQKASEQEWKKQLVAGKKAKKAQETAMYRALTLALRKCDLFG